MTIGFGARTVRRRKRRDTRILEWLLGLAFAGLGLLIIAFISTQGACQ